MSSKIPLFIAVALVLTGAGCGKRKSLPVTNAPVAPSEVVTEKPPQIPPPQPVDENATVVDNPTGSDARHPIAYPIAKEPVRTRPAGEICDPQNFICVSSSTVFKELPTTVSVTGTGIAFESTINWRIESEGKSVLTGYSMADAPDVGQPGLFTITTDAAKWSGKTVDLVIYEASAKDGTDTHVLRIPVRIR